MSNCLLFRGGLLAAALLAAGPLARAQTRARAQESATQPAPRPTAPTEKADDTGSLSAALGYGSNSAFFGRTQATAYPYLTQELTYTTKSGIWGSIYNYDLFNTASHFDETDFSLGYDRDLSKRVDASVSYSHFLFAANSPLVKSAVDNSLEAALGYDWQYVYTRLNGSYLFGANAQDFFLVLDNSHAFDFDEVLAAKDYVSFTPKFSLTAGTQYFAETSAQQQVVRGNKKPKTSKSGVVPVEATRFGLLSYALRLPLAYTLGKVSAEAAYRYVKPVNLLPEDDSSSQSYFTASLTLTL